MTNAFKKSVKSLIMVIAVILSICVVPITIKAAQIQQTDVLGSYDTRSDIRMSGYLDVENYQYFTLRFINTYWLDSTWTENVTKLSDALLFQSVVRTHNIWKTA